MLFAMALVACSGEDTSTDSEENESATNYPEQPVEMIVPYSAGGNTDLVARAVASHMKEYLGESVNVVNVEGGGGVLGMTEVNNANPDGYKISMTTNGPLTIKPHTEATYEYDDFKPVIQITEVGIGLAVSEDAPYDTYEEWLEWVEDNPGNFEYGTPGAGLTQHITMEGIQKELDIETKHVPYDSGGDAITAAVGGHIDGVFTQMTEIEPFINSGDLKMIFTAGTERDELVPDAPTLSELGVEVVGSVWTGVVVPKETPDEIVEILHDSFKSVLEDEDFIEQLNNLGAQVIYQNAEDFGEIVSNEYKNNGEILEDIGLIE